MNRPPLWRKYAGKPCSTPIWRKYAGKPFAAQRTCASLNRNDFQSTSTPTLIINAAYLRYFFVQLK
jgi:hypothetical protein